jgi:DNA polymerase
MEDDRSIIAESESWPVSIYRDLLINLMERVRFDMEMGVEDYALSLDSAFQPGETVSALSRQSRFLTIESLRLAVSGCKNCKLYKTRKNTVFGEGNHKTDIMFIGEGPGSDEDDAGLPFVGKAGQLLDKILKATGLNRNEVYITNVVKCRPPNNRIPEQDEISTCIPYLENQIMILKPKFIVCLGLTAAQTLLSTKSSIPLLRGKIHTYKGIKVLVTYHPGALLRNETLKRPVWEDMKFLMAEFKKFK